MNTQTIYFNGKTYKIPPIPGDLADKSMHGLKTIQATNANPISKLNSIYQHINEYNQFVKTFTVCQPTCSYCCKINVVISTLEAVYIAKNLNINYDSGVSITKNHTSPCPFLKDDTCSIYEHRPFNCRTFHTIDNPNYCNKQVKHVVYGSAEEGYGSDIYKLFKKELDKLNQYRPFRDIRDFFTNNYR